MTNLIIKVHPRYFTYLVNEQTYGTIQLGRSLIKNTQNIIDVLNGLNIKPTNIYIESPHIVLEGDKPTVFSNIQHVQRLCGALSYKMWEIYGVAVNFCLQSLPKPKKEELLLMPDKLLNNPKNIFFSPLELLCLADCILLLQQINKTNGR